MKNIFTSNGVYPGKRLPVKEKYRRLYHFTSFDTFVKIWLSGKLLFGDVQKVNDVQESDFSVSAVNMQQWAVILKYRELRLRYKQISLCMDYDSYIMGCMSTQMWAYYADKSQGVCIGIDFQKLKFPSSCLHDYVRYKQYSTEVHLDHRISTSKDIKKFIIRNKKGLFFTKQFTWKGENEYRIVSDSDDFLNISDAISCIYVTDTENTNFELLTKLVDNKVPIKRLKFINRNGLSIPVLTDAIHEKERKNKLKKDKNQILLHKQVKEKIAECENNDNKSLLMPFIEFAE